MRLVDRAHHPALARPDRDVPEPSPRRARLSRDLARPGRGRRRRRARARKRAAERSRADRARRAAGAAAQRADARSSPATAPRPSTRSAPWRSATTPSCSACAASSSRRSGAKDAAAARAYAEEAAKAAPALGWAGQAVLEFRCAAGDWAGALAALDRNSRYGLIDKAEYQRQRAVLLTARALAAEDERARPRARRWRSTR